MSQSLAQRHNRRRGNFKMYRPGYGVVTFVLAVLCVVGVVTTFLEPHIPPLPVNRMGKEQDEFLRQARREQVDWKPLSPDSFAEARRNGRPIFLMVGCPSSRIARYLDRHVFTDAEVAAFLQRNFSCIRIDGSVHPEWLNAIYPVARLTTRFQPDCQLWALDAVGRPFDLIARITGEEDFTPISVLSLLIDFRREFDRNYSGGNREAGSIQRQDMTILARTPTGLPVDFEAFRRDLASYVDGLRPGSPKRGYVGLNPLVWRYFESIGDYKSLEIMRDEILRSPMLDLLDGGCFHTILPSDGQTVEFDKQPVENAEAMLAMAEANVTLKDPHYDFASRATWAYLEKFAITNNGFVQGQLSEEGFKMRSPRYSVSARRLRDINDPPLEQWATENLGLDVSQFPQAVPFLYRDVLADARTSRLMGLLRKGNAPPIRFVEAGLADVSLTCIARSIQTARIWGDQAKWVRAKKWLQQLEDVRKGSDIMRRLNQDSEGLGYLGDYLAYADARLQAFLSTGSTWSLLRGFDVLLRAERLFHGDRPGEFVLNRPEQVLPIIGASNPEIADNLHESCTARMIRLMLAYGRLINAAPQSGHLIREAKAAVQTCAPIAALGGPVSAGFFCAAAELHDPAYAIAVGPNARHDADALARCLPSRLVAPAVGPVHPELQKCAAGIYIVRDKVEGPYTVSEVQTRLSPHFSVPGK